MKIVLIGGMGFIGLHLIRELQGHDIVVIDPHEPTEKEKDFLFEQKYYHRKDFFFPEYLDGCAKDADVVVSLPGQLGSVKSIEDPFGSLGQSVIPHLSLLSALANVGQTPLVIFPSSDLAYCTPPRCLYTIHKVTVENYLYVFNRIYGIPYIAFRMGTGYGPMQRRDSVVNFFVKRGLANEEIPVYGDGKNRQAFIYITDATKHFRQACEDYEYPANCVLPLATMNVAIVDVAKTVERLVGGKVVHKEWPTNVAEMVGVGDLPVDVFPGIGLEEGIRRTAEWMKTFDFD